MKLKNAETTTMEVTEYLRKHETTREETEKPRNEQRGHETSRENAKAADKTRNKQINHGAAREVAQHRASSSRGAQIERPCAQKEKNHAQKPRVRKKQKKMTIGGATRKPRRPALKTSETTHTRPNNSPATLPPHLTPPSPLSPEQRIREPRNNSKSQARYSGPTKQQSGKKPESHGDTGGRLKTTTGETAQPPKLRKSHESDTSTKNQTN